MQGNLAKQLAKLVKVKYVEDISLASRVGMYPCLWVPELHTMMPDMHTWVSESSTWIPELCAWVPDFWQQYRTCFLQFVEPFSLHPFSQSAAALVCPLLSPFPPLWLWQ